MQSFDDFSLRKSTILTLQVLCLFYGEHSSFRRGAERERERFTSSPTFLCGNTPATLG